MNGYEALVCSQCGGNEFKQFRFDLNSNSYLCLHCNTTFIPKPIDEHSSTKKLENAELYFHKFHDLQTSNKYYKEAVELNPENYRGWWGLAKVLSENFTNLSISTTTLNEINDYITKACVVSSEDVGTEIKAIYDNYYKSVTKEISEKITYIQKQNEDNKNKLNKTELSIKAKETEYSKITDEIDGLSKKLIYSDHTDIIKDAVARMIISGIIVFLLSKILFYNPDWEWDASTWIVGGPAIIAAIVFIVSLLMIIGFSVADTRSNIKNNQIRNKIDELNNQRNNIQNELKQLRNQKQQTNSVIEQLNMQKEAL